jgi:hypothetical protein
MTIDLVFANDGKRLTVEELLRAATFLDDAHVPDSAELLVEPDDASRVLVIRVQFEYRTPPVEPADF